MKKLSTLLLGLALTASASAQTAFRVHTFPSVMQKAEVKTRPQAHMPLSKNYGEHPTQICRNIRHNYAIIVFA